MESGPVLPSDRDRHLDFPGGPSDFCAFDPSSSLATQQVEEMVAAWQRGERPTAEDYLSRHPELGDEAAIRLIYEECCLRDEAGLAIDRAGLAQRFPRWWTELEVLLDCRQMIQAAPSPRPLPNVGESLAEFRLLAELGRGVSGKVFLASQPALADRPVVIKVTRGGRQEHLSLARLQHMNIVPLYWAQVLSDPQWLVLCMPFLGGATLAQVLDVLKSEPASDRTGRRVIEALDQVQEKLPVSLPARGPFRRYIATSPYVDAICWIGVCLADGLHYAHDRNFVHMDIKPSNVLIAGDGQPMLLDFHLAREPIKPGESSSGWLGGTPGYMAPEQADALAALREGRPILGGVDGRADLYSLGELLYEALGGPATRLEVGPRIPLHRANPRISVGLSDIIQKCLRSDPDDRYPDAAALASDLRRNLEGLPLRGVPNRSVVQRWRNWRRRQPHALARSVILMVATLTTAAALVLLWAAYRQRIGEVESALAGGRDFRTRQQFAEATKALRHGLTLSNQIPGLGGFRMLLVDELDRAQRDAKAADLHRLVELVRFRYGIDPPPTEEAESLLRRGRSIWQARGLLLRRIEGLREPEVERSIRSDLLDFALFWASLLSHAKPEGDRNQSTREALDVLAEANALLGPSRALERDRVEYARSLGQPPQTPATSISTDSPWEHFALGRSCLRSGELEQAAHEFEIGLNIRPQDFWLNFYQGLCAYRLSQFGKASSAFQVCIALAPNVAECFYNEALAENALGRTDEAVRDYTRALERNPSLTAAALNRGILHYHEGRLAEAAADLNHALVSTSRRGELGIIVYNLALVELARENRDRARKHLRDAVGLGHPGARELLDRLEREEAEGTPARSASKGARP